ncbi:MAG: tyrosine-protein phosphatase [bacterium]|nr:tyrosine-protein phosphatase [Candidatus Limimorpha equi]
MKEMLEKMKNVCVVLSVIIVFGISFSACHKTDKPIVLDTEVIGFDDFGNALLKLTPKEMADAGFELGDVLQMASSDTVFSLPYYDGYYCGFGGIQVISYNVYPNVMIASSFSPIPDNLGIVAGAKLSFSMFEKGGAIDIQQAMGVSYSNDIADYQNDAVRFANAREVKFGRIAEGRLFRTASPFDDLNNRAFYVSSFLQEKGVGCVLDLADDEERLQSLVDSMPEYSRWLYESGCVVPCKINANYRSDETDAKMLKGMVEMCEKPGPYVVHCLEGKDRTGYACAVLEAICGASYAEIVVDYMLTYENYYNYNQYNNPTFYNIIVSLRLNDALMYYCGIDDESLLPTIDLEASVRRFMLNHGLTETEIDHLQHVLCD